MGTTESREAAQAAIAALGDTPRVLHTDEWEDWSEEDAAPPKAIAFPELDSCVALVALRGGEPVFALHVGGLGIPLRTATGIPTCRGGSTFMESYNFAGMMKDIAALRPGSIHLCSPNLSTLRSLHFVLEQATDRHQSPTTIVSRYVAGGGKNSTVAFRRADAEAPWDWDVLLTETPAAPSPPPLSPAWPAFAVRFGRAMHEFARNIAGLARYAPRFWGERLARKARNLAGRPPVTQLDETLERIREAERLIAGVWEEVGPQACRHELQRAPASLQQAQAAQRAKKLCHCATLRAHWPGGRADVHFPFFGGCCAHHLADEACAAARRA
jgi:hypothetical protein